MKVIFGAAHLSVFRKRLFFVVSIFVTNQKNDNAFEEYFVMMLNYPKVCFLRQNVPEFS